MLWEKVLFMKINPIQILNKEDIPYYVNPGVLEQLNKGKVKVIEGNQDRIYGVTGREGSGKSTLAMQLAYVLDPTLTLKNIVFTSSQFEERIKTLSKYKALVFDESFNGLSSKGAISKENKRLVQLLMMCRQRNLFIFIVLPSFFLLEKYVAIFRSTALFNVMISKKNFKRRHYKVYNYQKKKILYLIGRKLMDYSKPRIAKSYRFYAKLPPSIDIKAYEKKKKDAFEEKDVKMNVESDIIKQRNSLAIKLNEKYGETYEEVSKGLEKDDCPLSSSVIGRFIRNGVKKRQTTSDNNIL